MSGYQDSNLGPPAPKAGALPGCATSRNVLLSFIQNSSVLGPWRHERHALPGCATSRICLSGEGEIRTLGTSFKVRRFSKPLV